MPDDGFIYPCEEFDADHVEPPDRNGPPLYGYPREMPNGEEVLLFSEGRTWHQVRELGDWLAMPDACELGAWR